MFETVFRQLVSFLDQKLDRVVDDALEQWEVAHLLNLVSRASLSRGPKITSRYLAETNPFLKGVLNPAPELPSADRELDLVQNPLDHDQKLINTLKRCIEPKTPTSHLQQAPTPKLSNTAQLILDTLESPRLESTDPNVSCPEVLPTYHFSIDHVVSIARTFDQPIPEYGF